MSGHLERPAAYLPYDVRFSRRRVRGSRHATRSPRYATEHNPSVPVTRHQASVAKEERGAIALQLVRLGRDACAPRRRRVPLAWLWV